MRSSKRTFHICCPIFLTFLFYHIRQIIKTRKYEGDNYNKYVFNDLRNNNIGDYEVIILHYNLLIDKSLKRDLFF